MKNKEHELLINLHSQSLEVNKKISAISNTNTYKITNNTTYSLINSNLNFQSVWRGAKAPFCNRRAGAH